jgi:excinuclease ABC subunit A
MLLAPVVRERKGEYTQLFEQLQGQGFVRARVDGEIIDIDTPPELDKRKNIPSKSWSIALKSVTISAIVLQNRLKLHYV